MGLQVLQKTTKEVFVFLSQEIPVSFILSEMFMGRM